MSHTLQTGHSPNMGTPPRPTDAFGLKLKPITGSREVLVDVYESGLKKINLKIIFYTFQNIGHLLGQKNFLTQEKKKNL